MTNEYNPDGKEIRFIDSHYKDLFHIPDGSCVQIHYPDETVVKPCTFIDERTGDKYQYQQTYQYSKRFVAEGGGRGRP